MTTTETALACATAILGTLLFTTLLCYFISQHSLNATVRDKVKALEVEVRQLTMGPDALVYRVQALERQAQRLAQQAEVTTQTAQSEALAQLKAQTTRLRE